MSSPQLATLTSVFLPFSSSLSLEDIQVTETAILLFVRNLEPSCFCPYCNQASERIHSHYKRILTDLPCGERQIQIHWTIRRFFCDSPDCPQITFSEQIPTLAQRYAHKTLRLVDKLQSVALEVGGEAGKRISAIFQVMISSDQMIRFVRSRPEAVHATPKVLGIDDWAWRKRQTYGTILVDLERRCVVDLLPDRRPETVAKWLKDHPEVEVISRDRGQDFIDGIAQGLPNAIQVADRFHLLRNLIEALQRMLERNPEELKMASKKVVVAPRTILPGPSNSSPDTKMPKNPRQEQFEQVKTLQSQGISQRDIARRMNLDRRTVGKYFDLEAPPSRSGLIGNASKVTPYQAHLQKRLNEGCRNLTELHTELLLMGFNGSYASVFRAVHRLGIGNLLDSVTPPPAILHFSPNQAAWAIFQTEECLKEPYLSFRHALCEISPRVTKAKDLVQAFREMLKNRQAEKLGTWLVEAESSSIPAFIRLAASFRSDLKAVHAGLSSNWSNGQVEGQVNRLKLIKRQMFGRAKFDLLRKRVLGPGPYS